MYSNERLALLREISPLNPIDSIRVYKECKKAEKVREIMAANDSSHVYSVDYSFANMLEYQLRMKALTHKLTPAWKEYLALENDGYGLDEFVEDYIAFQIGVKQNKTIK